MTDARLARGRRWFEYHCLESEKSADAELWHRTHQLVTVIAKSWDDGEIDPGSPNRGYTVEFSDGFVGDAFNDELVASPKDFYRPDYW